MAASSSGALKAYLELQGLGISVYRDRAPEGSSLPYVTVTESVTLTIDGEETQDTESNYRTAVEQVQIDLWQGWRNPDNTLAESYTLPNALLRALHGAKLPAAPQVVYGVLVVSSRRLTELDATPTTSSGTTYSGLVHHAITVNVRRQL